MKFRLALFLGLLLRITLLAWGTYQDRHSPVKYTDIDYSVYLDASNCVTHPQALNCHRAQGTWSPTWLGDPYSRSTYRYTPLLALMILPTSFGFPSFGKLVFISFDLIVSILLYHLVLHLNPTRHRPDSYATKIVSISWLLNPMIANISTRGSSEAIVGFLVTSTLYFAERGQWDKCAIVFGLSVHFKIFPVVYGTSLIVATMKPSKTKGRFEWKRPLKFGIISFTTFMLLNTVMYLLWGQPFISETFLYHLSRLDHRHNFSPYFYPYYLSSSTSHLSTTTPPSSPFSLLTTSLTSFATHPLSSFIPQMTLSLGLGFVFGHESLSFAWLVQTFAFVCFNKVVTSQYFLWYLWLIPPALHHIEMSRNRAILNGSIWVLSQAIWLSQAYHLEISGTGGFLPVWIAGIGFFIGQCWVLNELIRSYR